MANKSLGQIIIEALLSIVGNQIKPNSSGEIKASVNIPLNVPEQIPSQGIDWTDASYKITDHFTVGDAITLHAWNRLANESDGLTQDIKSKIVLTLQKMELVRMILNCPMNVHCTYRSPDYNQSIVKAIPNDVHAQGLAMDFDSSGHYTIDEVHALLLPHLENLNIRMEQNTPTWVHLDMHPVGHARYFLA